MHDRCSAVDQCLGMAFVEGGHSYRSPPGGVKMEKTIGEGVRNHATDTGDVFKWWM
jgi:hypothetical protein